jgi:hypothetical protein
MQAYRSSVEAIDAAKVATPFGAHLVLRVGLERLQILADKDVI